jgi:lipopolysaccharide transport system permease protein
MRMKQILDAREPSARAAGTGSLPTATARVADMPGLTGGHASRGPAKPRPVVYIKRSKGLVSPRLGELWQYRELLYFLIWRDVKVRYKQTALGIAWAVLQPLLTMAVFSLFFGRLARVPSDGVPYPLFAYCALVPWGFFANGLNMGSNSLVESANLIRKVYLPRLALPVATVLSGGVDFAVSFLLLLGMMWFYGVAPQATVMYLPLFLLLALVTSLGVSLWLSALNVQYRDVRYTIPFLIQIWMFATPIAYPSSLVPGKWRVLYGLNPMVGVIEGFRWALLGTATRPGAIVLVSCAASLLILVTGMMYFRHAEKTFADVV